MPEGRNLVLLLIFILLLVVILWLLIGSRRRPLDESGTAGLPNEGRLRDDDERGHMDANRVAPHADPSPGLASSAAAAAAGAGAVGPAAMGVGAWSASQGADINEGADAPAADARAAEAENRYAETIDTDRAGESDGFDTGADGVLHESRLSSESDQDGFDAAEAESRAAVAPGEVAMPDMSTDPDDFDLPDRGLPGMTFDDESAARAGHGATEDVAAQEASIPAAAGWTSDPAAGLDHRDGHTSERADADFAAQRSDDGLAGERTDDDAVAHPAEGGHRAEDGDGAAPLATYTAGVGGLAGTGGLTAASGHLVDEPGAPAAGSADRAAAMHAESGTDPVAEAGGLTLKWDGTEGTPADPDATDADAGDRSVQAWPADDAEAIAAGHNDADLFAGEPEPLAGDQVQAWAADETIAADSAAERGRTGWGDDATPGAASATDRGDELDAARASSLEMQPDPNAERRDDLEVSGASSLEPGGDTNADRLRESGAESEREKDMERDTNAGRDSGLDATQSGMEHTEVDPGRGADDTLDRDVDRDLNADTIDIADADRLAADGDRDSDRAGNADWDRSSDGDRLGGDLSDEDRNRRDLDGGDRLGADGLRDANDSDVVRVGTPEEEKLAAALDTEAIAEVGGVNLVWDGTTTDADTATDTTGTDGTATTDRTAATEAGAWGDDATSGAGDGAQRAAGAAGATASGATAAQTTMAGDSRDAGNAWSETAGTDARAADNRAADTVASGAGGAERSYGPPDDSSNAGSDSIVVHDHEVVDGGWGVGSAAPTEDGCMPLGHPIKGVFALGIYQVPGSDWYDQTQADVWFLDEEAAQRAGFSRGEG